MVCARCYRGRGDDTRRRPRRYFDPPSLNNGSGSPRLVALNEPCADMTRPPTTAASAFKPDESGSGGGLLPPPHPAEESAAREDQAGNASADDGAGDGCSCSQALKAGILTTAEAT